MPTHLQTEQFVFGGENELRLVAKRYSEGDVVNTDGLTLLVAHGVGGQKEHWEPTLERIFKLQKGKERRFQIREAWSFDMPSHGEAGEVNREVLAKRPETPPSAHEWGALMTDFVKTKMQGHRVVVAGHSAGNAPMIFVLKAFPVERPPYLSFFVVEPSLISEEYFKSHYEERMTSANLSAKMTVNKRATFPNMEEAENYLRKRLPWKKWDERVFQRYLEHGFRSEETPQGPVITPKTNPKQEGLAYPDIPPYMEAGELIFKHSTAGVMPIHVIFGGKIDFVPRDLQDHLVDTSKGRRFASVTRVPGAGHLVVQEKPDGLADAICERLDANGLSRPKGSKL